MTNDLVALFVDALDGGHVDRRRQIVDHRVEQRLHALVLEGRAAQHGIERAGQHGLADQALQRRFIRLVAVEIGGHGVVVEFDGGFHHLLAIFLGLLDQICGNLGMSYIAPSASSFQTSAFMRTRSIRPLKLFSEPIGSWIAIGLRAEPIDDVLQTLVEVGAGLIHLVGEDDARNLVLVTLTPDGFGLRLDALVGVEHAYGAVEHAQGALDFDGEVDVAGGVDDVQTLAVPERGGSGRRNGDAALLLLLHPVHRRGTFVHFADLVALAGVIKDALGRRGLAGVDMRHDTEITVILDGMKAGHGLSLNSCCVAVTSDSARTHGWLPPSCARLPAS